MVRYPAAQAKTAADRAWFAAFPRYGVARLRILLRYSGSEWGPAPQALRGHTGNGGHLTTTSARLGGSGRRRDAHGRDRDGDGSAGAGGTPVPAALSGGSGSRSPLLRLFHAVLQGLRRVGDLVGTRPGVAPALSPGGSDRRSGRGGSPRPAPRPHAARLDQAPGHVAGRRTRRVRRVAEPAPRPGRCRSGTGVPDAPPRTRERRGARRDATASLGRHAATRDRQGRPTGPQRDDHTGADGVHLRPAIGAAPRTMDGALREGLRVRHLQLVVAQER
jgi:hypothetical protein